MEISFLKNVAVLEMLESQNLSFRNEANGHLLRIEHNLPIEKSGIKLLTVNVKTGFLSRLGSIEMTNYGD